MHRIGLIHWKEEEQAERAARLGELGYAVVTTPADGAAAARALRADPPAAVVIDLGRLPSHGRELANTLRQSQTTRAIPIVFVEGPPEKVARIRELLPDATFTTWNALARPLARAIANPPLEPVVPSSVMAGHSGTPLPKKLGIRPGAVVALIDAPEDFEATLGELPEGATLRHDLRVAPDLVVLFVRARNDLGRGLARVAPKVNGGKVWIAWPKKSSGVVTDVAGGDVRAEGLARGLVDFKVAAIDATWSGLHFSPRK